MAINLQAAFTRLDQFIEQKLKETQTAGVVVSVTDRERTLHVAACGYANVTARKPVMPDTLFEIGSIGKSFTSLALLQLHAAGQLDLHAPITRYLPWFQIRSQSAPISVHHLMSHTAGLPQGSDITSDSRYGVYLLRELETGFAPGEKFWYSNVGYQALGWMLEERLGQS